MFDDLQATGRQVSRLAYHRGTVRDCSWHPTEPMLVSSSWDGNLAKWEHLHGDRPLARNRNQRCLQLPETSIHNFFLDDYWLIDVFSWRFIRFFRHSFARLWRGGSQRAEWSDAPWRSKLFSGVQMGGWLYLFAERSCWWCLLGVHIKEAAVTSMSHIILPEFGDFWVCSSKPLLWWDLSIRGRDFLCIAAMCTWKKLFVEALDLRVRFRGCHQWPLFLIYNSKARLRLA